MLSVYLVILKERKYFSIRCETIGDKFFFKKCYIIFSYKEKIIFYLFSVLFQGYVN